MADLPLVPLVRARLHRCGAAGASPHRLALLAALAVAACQAPRVELDDSFALSGSVIYPRDQILSPLSSDVLDRLRSILRNGTSSPTELSETWGPPRDDVFVKVGDSISAYSTFMACFTADDVLAMPEAFHHPALSAQNIGETVDFFAGGQISVAQEDDTGTRHLSGSVDPFQRVSHAACGGTFAYRPLDPDAPVCARPPGEQPAVEVDGLSPLEREVIQARPRFALVMFGTNDVGVNAPAWFGRNMLDNIRYLMSEGIVPVLYTIPPRLDVPVADVAVHNEVIRAISERYRLPLIDFHLALTGLAGWGLSGDGVHPSATSHLCSFSGGMYMPGQHMRNLLSIEMLTRLHQELLDDEPQGDDSPAAVTGSGTKANPYQVTQLPFTMLRTGRATLDNVGEYASYACGQGDLPETDDVYEFVATRAVMRITVLPVDWEQYSYENPRRTVVEECMDESCSQWRCRWIGNSYRTIYPQPGTRYRMIIESPPGVAGDYVVMVR